ncbi:Ferredoxin subunit of nitrite reductase or a ring-hydroxylating dioxygenase [Halopelagius inordinatus]|uniref:Ferredoxin subunit of nitrite reductase or a ring-hydroxylating dioxygenase n=1 Tax=Halopelagius inordinatus TaxID=553467 RepID=A0A1I2MKG8_9EURY|nr:Rieske 2Fe-2S domain-containing protein [Halopelagius inordinatus]SFF91410.1 Ferredoxin subunit of nitrite reductase or a ring-hydroxylating dioxygenase [Halopelagius inordinatus]
MDDSRRIAATDDVPDDGTLLCTLSGGDEKTEAILTRLDDGTIVAFANYCPHWTDVRLDKGSSALVRDGELVCQKHGATFERDSGVCNFGPCEGAMLETIDVVAENGSVLLTDDDYAFESLGASQEYDRSSGNQIGF